MRYAAVTMRVSSASITIFAVLVAASLSACRDARPAECQRLRQCCQAASASGVDLEPVRVACTRPEDDAVLCRRRLEEVQVAAPSVGTSPECRLP